MVKIENGIIITSILDFKLLIINVLLCALSKIIVICQKKDKYIFAYKFK